MEKPATSGLSLLQKNEIVMYEFWHDYVEPKSKIILHGYRKLYSLHKNRKHLRRYNKRCSKKIWYFKL